MKHAHTIAMALLALATIINLGTALSLLRHWCKYK